MLRQPFESGFRLFQILRIFLKYRLHRGLPDLFTDPANLTDPNFGRDLRQALEILGPIFVKFGQLLSTRSDLLPESLLQELRKLQDRVPPFDGQLAQATIEQALAQPIQALFSDFDLKPLASASIAQVHAAKTLSGQAVVVKVLRPNIEKIIAIDLNLLRRLASLVETCSAKARRFKPKAMVEEFRKCLQDELDLMREAANASQLRRNFLGNSTLYIPEIHWSLSNRRVLTLERLHGTALWDLPQLREQKVCFKSLAERLVNLFFTQVFRDCFFHADMHPGNLLVDAQCPQNPRYLAVDFGIIGTLNRADQRYLAENFLAFFKRDYRRVAELHIESGWVPQHTRADEFANAIRIVSEPMFERPLKDISFGNTLLRLLKTAERFEMNIQPQFLLLQKTLLNVEGISRQLYPDLDLWQTSRPFLERWMKDQIGPRQILRKWRNLAPYWLERLPEILSLKNHAHPHLSLSIQAPFRPALEPKTKSWAFWQGFLVGLLALALLLFSWRLF